MKPMKIYLHILLINYTLGAIITAVGNLNFSHKPSSPTPLCCYYRVYFKTDTSSKETELLWRYNVITYFLAIVDTHYNPVTNLQ